MATFVITGFGPFPGASDNPSARLVARLTCMRRPALGGHKLVTHVFATSYAAIDHDVPALVARHRPRVIIMFGLAARTNYIRIERQARNRVSLLFPDAAHVAPQAGAIRLKAPSALRGRASFTRMAAAVRASGVAGRLSNDAGRYVCNYAYWRGLEAAAQRGGPEIVVFVHVPKLHERTRRPAKAKHVSLDQLVRAAQALLISAASAARRR